MNTSWSGRVDLHPSGAAPLGNPLYPRPLSAAQSERGQAALPDLELFIVDANSVSL